MLLILQLRERHHSQEVITIPYLLAPVTKETLTKRVKDGRPCRDESG